MDGDSEDGDFIYAGELLSLRVCMEPSFSSISPQYSLCCGTNNSTAITLLSDKSSSNDENEEIKKSELVLMVVRISGFEDKESEKICYGDTVSLFLPPNDNGQILSCCLEGGTLYWRECDQQDTACHFIVGGLEQCGQILQFGKLFNLQNAESCTFVSSTEEVNPEAPAPFKLLECTDAEDGIVKIQFMAVRPDEPVDRYSTSANNTDASPSCPENCSELPPEAQPDPNDETGEEKVWVTQEGALPTDELKLEESPNCNHTSDQSADFQTSEPVGDEQQVPPCPSEDVDAQTETATLEPAPEIGAGSPNNSEDLCETAVVEKKPEASNIPELSKDSSGHLLHVEDVVGEELVVMFGNGPMGVTLRRTSDGRACFRSVLPYAQAYTLGIEEGDILVEANGLDLRSRSLSNQDDWQSLIAHIQKSGRPMKVCYVRPDTRRRNRDRMEYAASMLYFPPSSSTISRGLNPLVLNNGERRLLHSGQVQVVSTKQTMQFFTMVPTHHIEEMSMFVFDDLIVLAKPCESPGLATLQVEHTIEIITMKLNILPEVWTPTCPTVFEIVVGPTGTSILVKTSSLETRLQWLTIIRGAVLNAFAEKSLNLVSGWEHHVILGTTHSAALLGDLQLLAALKENNMLEIDATDSERFTPLHYAVSSKRADIIQFLLAANADTHAGDRAGRTPTHLAALLLQDSLLGLLLPKMKNVNVQDYDGCTPFYLAVVRDGPINDCLSMRRCVQAFKAWGANASIKDKYGYSALLLLSKEWKHEELEILLEANVDIRQLHTATGSTAVHLACLPPFPSNEATPEDAESKPSVAASNGRTSILNLSTTLSVLLRYGCPPNARDSQGRTALRILLEQEGEHKASVVAAVKVLIAFGAQTEDEKALRLDMTMKSLASAAVAQWEQKQCREFSEREVLLGSDLEEQEAQERKLESQGEKLKCLYCQSGFTLISRKHHCKVCTTLVCKKCSSKHIKVSNTTIRVCDCCFNRLKNNQEMNQDSDSQITEFQQSGGFKAVNTSEKYKNLSDRLFGDKERPAPEEQKDSKGAMFSGLNTALRGMQEGFSERGERLAQLGDKSEQLKDVSAQFEEMARALNTKPKSWW